MAAPTTLAQFWRNEVDAYTLLDDRVSARLAAAQSALQTAHTRLGDALGALAGAQRGLVQAKAALAAEADLGEIPAKTVAVRQWQAAANGAQGAVAQATDALAEQQVRVAVLTGAAAAIDAKLADAKAKSAAADARDLVRVAWRTKAAAAPLATLIADAQAGAAVASEPLKSARKNLNDNYLKNGYVDLADARFDLELDGYQKAFAENRALRKSYTDRFPAGASAETVEAWRAEFERTWAELGDFVLRGKARFDQAIATLTALQTAALLTPNETAEFNGGSLSAAGIAAAAAAGTTDRDAALKAVVDELAAYEQAVAAALKADPMVDPSTVSAATLSAAIATLQAKQAAYDAPSDPTKPWTSPHGALSSWLTALPDDVYREVASYYAAREALEEIGGLTSGGALDPLAAFDAAESSYAGSLDAAAKAEKLAYFHKLVVDAQAKRLDRVTLARRDHLFSLVRGDI
jgi:hypothetical protein